MFHPQHCELWTVTSCRHRHNSHHHLHWRRRRRQRNAPIPGFSSTYSVVVDGRPTGKNLSRYPLAFWMQHEKMRYWLSLVSTGYSWQCLPQLIPPLCTYLPGSAGWCSADVLFWNFISVNPQQRKAYPRPQQPVSGLPIYSTSFADRTACRSSFLFLPETYRDSTYLTGKWRRRRCIWISSLLTWCLCGSCSSNIHNKPSQWNVK